MPVHGTVTSNRRTYVLGRELGRGAYGIVYKSRDIKTQDSYAVKRIEIDSLPVGECNGEWSAASVEREVELMKKLDHRNVIRVVDYIRTGSEIFLVTELCQGPNLQAVIDARGALEMDECAACFRQCVSALRHLHEHGVVHRDIKPDNVVYFDAVEDVRVTPLATHVVKLIDFGLARLLPPPAAPRKPRRPPRASPASSPDASVHGPGTVDLSAHAATLFAPPEVQKAWGEKQRTLSLSCRDATRLDVYALGALLRYMLLGATPQQQLDALSARSPARARPSPPHRAPHDPPAAAEDAVEGCGCLPLLGGRRAPRLPARAAAQRSARVLRQPAELPAGLQALIERMTAEDAAGRIGLTEVARQTSGPEAWS